MADETKLTAATRLEKLLDNIAGGENEVTPATRLEKFLSYIADAMEGGGGSGGGGTAEIPVYEIKSLPAGAGDGYYIDGDPAEITSGVCILKSYENSYIPVYMLADEGIYAVWFIDDYDSDSGAGLIKVYSTGASSDPEYAAKLCYVSGGVG